MISTLFGTYKRKIFYIIVCFNFLISISLLLEYEKFVGITHICHICTLKIGAKVAYIICNPHYLTKFTFAPHWHMRIVVVPPSI